MDENQEPSRQGWMRTTMGKMIKINKWADRYFVLHGPVLYYYMKNTDTVSYDTDVGMFIKSFICMCMCDFYLSIYYCVYSVL